MTEPLQPEDNPPTNDVRLRTLATVSSVVVWHTAPDGSVIAHNPSWQAFTGQTFDECRGWGWLDAVHPEDREAVGSHWTEGVRSGSLVDLTYRLKRYDGVYRHMAAQGAPVREDGQLQEWVGFCVDVTDSRRAEETLKASEGRLQFLDQLGQATRALTDADELMQVTARMLGQHLGATRCAYADVEADSDRFTIRHDWALEGVASSAGVYSLDLFGPLATSNLRQGHHLVVHDVDKELGEDGGARMFKAIGIRAVVCTALVKEGRLVALMAVHQATPRQWTAAEISVIEDVVDRCWAHIERVRDSAMLHEQDRRKDEFLATLAHELRNPLAPIKYAVAVMRKGAAGADGARAHEVIDRQVSHMARLIDDLLDLSRINRGLIQLKLQPVLVADLVRQGLVTATPAIDAARHHLEVQVADEDLWLNADPARMVQVIGNLLTNAAKYTPDGGQIRLTARREGREALISVADNGIGVPQEQQGQLFKMFTQLPHTAERTQGGLGIGLALVRTLMEMHGGRVAMSSAGLDEGSTFTLHVPLAAATVQPDAIPASPEAPAPAAEGGTRVLVVEDNKDGRETLMVLLEAMGYVVAGAADGLEGVSVAGSFLPDVVLLDLGLPRMDGFGVARALRSDPKFKDVHIVALTGWGTDQDRVRTTEAGFNAHLTKPVEPDVLEAYLAGLLTERKQAATGH
ncbi:MAG TPA: ATP-binding protein [Polaromonas sp.]|uniref:hybrid sensor histidine kinase/response regulator n=1 Tax=Polaromonas sp. TaxID=1869339 RepID=UPI002D5B3DA4|nr:ATP-binding protein [Polaromonas sp.]HYW58346.1 ATP-binding protein [Polaromonas sp.]